MLNVENTDFIREFSLTDEHTRPLSTIEFKELLISIIEEPDIKDMMHKVCHENYSREQIRELFKICEERAAAAQAYLAKRYASKK